MNNDPTPRIFNRQGETESKRPWFEIKNRVTETGSKAVEVMIYDNIGSWGLRATDFVRDLKAMDDGSSNIIVAIDSDGGDVFDGFAISNALSRLGERCTARIDGLAASAASIIACGAHKVVMAANTQMMIHNPWTAVAGDADELRQTANMLDKVTDGLVATYQAKAPKLEAARLKQMLNDETWLSPVEAIALGLADEVEGVTQPKARAMSPILASYRKVPKNLITPADPVPENNPPSPPQPNAAALALKVLSACREAGLADMTESVLMSIENMDQIEASITRAKGVQALCFAAKFPELASDFIKAGLATEAVKARLFDKLSQLEGNEINNSLPPELEPEKTPAKATPQCIYDQRRQSRMPHSPSNKRTTS
ncbi:head maturation protease, ClpP-related [Chitinimonas sp. PSY-7]|uniref:head maturation protease, ClpP-related n=1 Tax=Chitinimonas sp. PSY-7 TaxID=3459088 RepID=UPI00403FE914